MVVSKVHIPRNAPQQVCFH